MAKKTITKKKVDQKPTTEGELVQPPTPDETPQVAQEPEVGSELVHQPQREAVLSIVGGVTTAELRRALEVQTEQRALINQFIKDNLVEDIDYGKIHVVKSCPAEDRQRGSCDKSYHFSKSILFKPGQEKIFSLFGITDELEKDEEAYAMLANVPGLVAYKDVMYRGGKKVGEGRGAATLGGSQNDPNSTIKKAEKRARMDACLSLGFSAYFTQDLDDPEYASQREMMNSKAAAEAERRDRDEFGLMPRDPELPIDNQERATLHRIILKAGFTDADEILELLKTNGIPEPQAMTSGQARAMMGKLTHSLFAPPPSRPQAKPDVVIEDIDDAPIDLPDLPPESIEPPEPELVIDEDLKNNVQMLADSIALTARGQMWLYQKICGKPFVKWEKLTDQEWRDAFRIVQGILDQEYDVPEQYMMGYVEEGAPVDYTQSKTADIDIDQIQTTFPGAEVIDTGKPK